MESTDCIILVEDVGASEDVWKYWVMNSSVRTVESIDATKESDRGTEVLTEVLNTDAS